MAAKEHLSSGWSEELGGFGKPGLLPSELWRLALIDAAIRADEAYLFVFPARSATRNEATSWVPGTTIDEHDEVEDFGQSIDVANSTEVRGLHRVAIWPAGRPHEVNAALLRHELEHSRQFELHGSTVRDLFLAALDMLVEYTRDIHGAGVLYQHIPMERDADAAASGFVRTVFGDAAVDVHEEGHWPLLARNADSPDPVSIRFRMQQFVETDGPALAKRFAAGVSAGAAPKEFRRPCP